MNRSATKMIKYGIERRGFIGLRQLSQATSQDVAVNESQGESLIESTSQPVTFAKLFKNSKFVALGGLRDSLLIGKIVDVVADDLYIDYGGKFNCVCKIPQTKNNRYFHHFNFF